MVLHDLCVDVTMVGLASSMVVVEIWVVPFDFIGTGGSSAPWHLSQHLFVATTQCCKQGSSSWLFEGGFGEAVQGLVFAPFWVQLHGFPIICSHPVLRVNLSFSIERFHVIFFSISPPFQDLISDFS